MFSKVFNFTSIGNMTDSNKNTNTFCNIFETFQNNSNYTTSTQKQNLFESLKFTTCTEGIEAVFAIYFPALIYNNPVVKWSLSSHKNKTIVFSIFQSSPEEYTALEKEDCINCVR